MMRTGRACRLDDNGWLRSILFAIANAFDLIEGRKATLEMMLAKAGPGIRFNEREQYFLDKLACSPCKK
jgi:hypothetical protein